MSIATVVTVVGLIKDAISAAPTVIQTTKDMIDLGAKFWKTLTGEEPTEQERAELESRVDALHTEIQTLPDHD